MLRSQGRASFRGRTVLGGPDLSWLALAVPGWVANEIGAETARFPVVVTIEGHSYRSWLRRSLDGGYVLYVNVLVRQRAALSAGDEVAVEIEADAEPRGAGMPEELRAVLEEDADAAHGFRRLSYEERRDVVRYVQEARTTLGRTSRVARVQARLRAGSV